MKPTRLNRVGTEVGDGGPQNLVIFYTGDEPSRFVGIVSGTSTIVFCAETRLLSSACDELGLGNNVDWARVGGGIGVGGTNHQSGYLRWILLMRRATARAREEESKITGR